MVVFEFPESVVELIELPEVGGRTKEGKEQGETLGGLADLQFRGAVDHFLPSNPNFPNNYHKVHLASFRIISRSAVTINCSTIGDSLADLAGEVNISENDKLQLLGLFAPTE